MRSPVILTMMLVLLAAAGCQSTPAQITQRSTPTAQKQHARTKSIIPFLMFQDGRAEEAINRYIEVFGDAGGGRIIFLQRYGENPVGAPEDSIMHAVFEIYGQRIGVTESPIKHPFDFTPAVSLFVDFASAQEQERVFAALSEGGEVMMPLDNYGFSDRFAFIQDRYGVSWQLNLPKSPAAE